MQILENKRALLPEFVRLNNEWIDKYFEREEVDFQLAANPEGVIAEGGFIFSLLEGEEVLGVCALFKNTDEVYELARMAVSPKAQGKGYANKLINACFEKLNDIGAKKVFLVSNTKLKPAIKLYEKHGFETVALGPHPIYKRADIIMEKQLHAF